MRSPLLLLTIFAITATTTLAVQPALALVDPTESVPLELTDCDYVESLNVVPGPLVDPFVPPGFTVTAVANLVWGMATCTGTSGTESERVTFGWADVSVVPPAGFRSPQGGTHLFRIEHLAMDDLYGRVHAQWGTECRVLDSAEVVAQLIDTHAIAKQGAFEQILEVPAAPESTEAAATIHYREFGLAEGGLVWLEGDLVRPAGTETLAGAFVTGEGSPLRSILGPAGVTQMQYSSTIGIRGTTINYAPWSGAVDVASSC